jgi:hypothetical protein
VSISNDLEDKILNLVFNATAYSGQATVYVKLHTGDPGEAGTNNAATHTTRAAATFGTASGGAISNDAAVTFTSMAANETISHISLWDASSGGNCLWIGALTASKSVNTGDTFQINTGDLDITLD